MRGFATRESAVLTAVTQVRATALCATASDMRLEAETQAGQTVTSMMSPVARYPELAASSHFRELRMELAGAENRMISGGLGPPKRPGK